jgi:hypothetical protein
MRFLFFSKKQHLEMTKILLILLSFAFSANLQAQQIEKKEGIFFQYEQKLSKSKLQFILLQNRQTIHYAQRAQAIKTIGLIAAGTGAGLLGWGITDLIINSKTNPSLIVGGAGLTLLSIPLLIKANNELQEGINLYNSDINNLPQPKISSQIKVTSTPNGLRLVLVF